MGSASEVPPEDALIDPSEIEDFLNISSAKLQEAELSDILRRAIKFLLQSPDADIEVQFISFYAALESALTFFRRNSEFRIIPKDQFATLERDLRQWLKQHPLMVDDSARRGLIYEKIRELNRIPFSHMFRRFCEHYSLDLSDLWPVVGSADEWPLMEIRHRLVHGDPFASCPGESMICAGEHLRWTVERMLLVVLGWPVTRSNVSDDYLRRTSYMYKEWRAERVKFA
ncbi:MAG: hypothetical protein QOJ64_281 [Acidobacteriota bacterium]|nr:hypothetical protein [Acidobacteriota bacterium]